MVDKELVRKQLIAYVRDHEVDLTKLAQEIGIAYNTLSSVLRSQGNVYLRTLLKIEKCLNEKEIETLPMDDKYERGTITQSGWVSDGEKWIKVNKKDEDE